MAEKVLSGRKERGGLWCGSLSMICSEDERDMKPLSNEIDFCTCKSMSSFEYYH